LRSAPEAADPQRLLHRVRLLGGGYHEDAVLGPCDEGPVEPGQALLADLVEQLLDALHLCLGTELQGDQGLGASADAMGDVIPCHDEVLAVPIAPPDHDMGVRAASVEMVHGHPVELGVQVALHLGEQVANEGLEIRKPGALVGGDDEAELVRVLLGPVQEGAAVDVVAVGIVEPAGGALARDAIAHDVLHVRPGRTQVAGDNARVARLDDDAPASWSDEAGGGPGTGAHAALGGGR
jgi:hypothetical protein